MMPDPVHVAYGGVALATSAAVMLILAVCFGDRFLKTDRELRRWMDTILWCMVIGLLVTAVVVTWTVARLHH